MKYKKEVHFCQACGGAGMGCPDCEHGIIEETVRPEEEKKERIQMTRVSLKPRIIDRFEIIPKDGTLQKIGTCSHHSGEADMYSVLVDVRRRFVPTFLCVFEEAVRECTARDGDYSTTTLVAAFEVRCSAKSYSELLVREGDSDVMRALKKYFHREEREEER